MIRRLVVPALVLIAAFLAACAAAPTRAEGATQTPAEGQVVGGLPTQSPPPAGAANAGLARTDSQASVEFVVTPLNLDAPGETLDFDVSMNTHSVDLSWNLAAQSVLSSDTGLKVNGLNWPLGSGHHYEDTLTFPAQTAEGKSLLEGAKTLTLTIRDTGVPERVFVWELP